ncbi:hypothetical protein Bbelb_323650 [Branchiostoma belcheri]|nr:hypothetical protein Bbelb_323650 [Branchiostoma belcheri]
MGVPRPCFPRCTTTHGEMCDFGLDEEYKRLYNRGPYTNMACVSCAGSKSGTGTTSQPPPPDCFPRIDVVQIDEYPVRILTKEWMEVFDPANLQFLSIANAGMVSVADNAFASHEFVRLTNVFLARNRLSHVKRGWFKGLSSLNTLSLASNRVAKIDAAGFAEMEFLQTLFLNDNRLTTIDPNWFLSLKHLDTVHLGSNLMGAIPARAFANLPALVMVNLRGNPLSCVDRDAFQGLVVPLKARLGADSLVPLDGGTPQTVAWKLESSLEKGKTTESMIVHDLVFCGTFSPGRNDYHLKWLFGFPLSFPRGPEFACEGTWMRKREAGGEPPLVVIATDKMEAADMPSVCRQVWESDSGLTLGLPGAPRLRLGTVNGTGTPMGRIAMAFYTSNSDEAATEAKGDPLRRNDGILEKTVKVTCLVLTREKTTPMTFQGAPSPRLEKCADPPAMITNPPAKITDPLAKTTDAKTTDPPTEMATTAGVAIEDTAPTDAASMTPMVPTEEADIDATVDVATESDTKTTSGPSTTPPGKAEVAPLSLVYYSLLSMISIPAFIILFVIAAAAQASTSDTVHASSTDPDDSTTQDKTHADLKAQATTDLDESTTQAKTHADSKTQAATDPDDSATQATTDPDDSAAQATTDPDDSTTQAKTHADSKTQAATDPDSTTQDKTHHGPATKAITHPDPMAQGTTHSASMTKGMPAVVPSAGQGLDRPVSFPAGPISAIKISEASKRASLPPIACSNDEEADQAKPDASRAVSLPAAGPKKDKEVSEEVEGSG